MPSAAMFMGVLMPMPMPMPMLMPVPIPMPDRGTTIGTCFWLEGRLLSGHRQPEPAYHRIQHMIVQPAQPPCLDLQRHMPVAKMIGGSRKQ